MSQLNSVFSIGIKIGEGKSVVGPYFLVYSTFPIPHAALFPPMTYQINLKIKLQHTSPTFSIQNKFILVHLDYFVVLEVFLEVSI